MNASFLIADDIQPLHDGKPLAVGVYPDRVLVVGLPAEQIEALSVERPAGMDRLCIMVTVWGFDQLGLKEAKLAITAPDGQPFGFQQETLQFQAVEGMSSNLLFRLAPFVFYQAGTYQLRLSVDGDSVEATLEVRIRQTPVTH